ncbi:MAG: response regulator transcription factor [Bacteroidales bacterium]|jgi:DNA-binding NarL/FixJ family response regulator|nr:response regulator transcription factor [Bacteroidales bacterium]
MKILIVEDHNMVREVLSKLMRDADKKYQVVEAKNGLEAVLKAHEEKPDVVIMDYDMPVYNGIFASRKLQQELPDIPVLMLSMYQSKEHIMDAVQAGVKGYLPKEARSEELLEAVKALKKGGNWFKGDVAEIIAANISLSENKKVKRKKSNLTPRELQLIQHFAEGMQSAEIAELCYISKRTVEVHKSNIFKKLGIRNNTELIRYAIRNQLVKI